MQLYSAGIYYEIYNFDSRWPADNSAGVCKGMIIFVSREVDYRLIYYGILLTLVISGHGN